MTFSLDYIASKLAYIACFNGANVPCEHTISMRSQLRNYKPYLDVLHMYSEKTQKLLELAIIINYSCFWTWPKNRNTFICHLRHYLFPGVCRQRFCFAFLKWWKTIRFCKTVNRRIYCDKCNVFLCLNKANNCFLTVLGTFIRNKLNCKVI